MRDGKTQKCTNKWLNLEQTREKKKYGKKKSLGLCGKSIHEPREKK